MKSQKQFFLISFLPAFAYWYLEENYGLPIALIAGIGLALVEIILERIFTKHIHTISKLNLGLILFLGLLSIGANEGIWFKLQPFFTGLVMGSVLLFKFFRGESLMYEMVASMNTNTLPKGLIMWLERNLAILLVIYGLFMAYIACYQSTETWLFFKTAGFYITFLVFSILQMVYLRFKMRRDH